MVTLPPMQASVYEAIRMAGRLGITGKEIASVIGWWQPGHGPLDVNVVYAHIYHLRKRGIRIESKSGIANRYRLPEALAFTRFVSSDLGAPLHRAVTRQLLGRKPAHFHHNFEPVRRHKRPLVHGKAGDPQLLSNREHQPAGLGDLLQSDAARCHSDLISRPPAQVKTLDNR